MWGTIGPEVRRMRGDTIKSFKDVTRIIRRGKCKLLPIPTFIKLMADLSPANFQQYTDIFWLLYISISTLDAPRTVPLWRIPIVHHTVRRLSLSPLKLASLSFWDSPWTYTSHAEKHPLCIQLAQLRKCLKFQWVPQLILKELRPILLKLSLRRKPAVSGINPMVPLHFINGKYVLLIRRSITAHRCGTIKALYNSNKTCFFPVFNHNSIHVLSLDKPACLFLVSLARFFCISTLPFVSPFT